MIDPGEKPFVLTSLERARSEAVFEALEAVYSGVPHSTCSRRAFCCRESPRIYFVEFLNLYRALMERPRQEQVVIQERCIRYAFLDLCDPTICCPLLEGNRCLLYEARGLRCRVWGHQSRVLYDRHISAANKTMTKIAKLMAQYGMEIPEEILAFRTPYCRVMVRNSDYLTDEDAVRLEARLRLLDCRFLETANPEDRRVDFSRQLYRAFFGLKDYGTTRVRVMREYLERRSEEALQPLLERVRAKTLS